MDLQQQRDDGQQVEHVADEPEDVHAGELLLQQQQPRAELSSRAPIFYLAECGAGMKVAAMHSSPARPLSTRKLTLSSS